MEVLNAVLRRTLLVRAWPRPPDLKEEERARLNSAPAKRFPLRLQELHGGASQN